MRRMPPLRDRRLITATSACVGLAIGILGVPASALACSCVPEGAATAWPEDGSSDVPLDTPLVFYRFGFTAPPRYALTSENGDEVPLTVIETIAPAFDGCGVGTFETTFLRPAQPLEPHTAYTFEAEGNELADASFTTGEDTFTPEAMVGELQYLLVRQPNCVGSNCRSLAEAHMELGAPVETPRWLVVESAAVQDNRNTFVFWPGATGVGSNWQLSVALPEHDSCIDVRVYGLEGVPLFEEPLRPGPLRAVRLVGRQHVRRTIPLRRGRRAHCGRYLRRPSRSPDH
jgi:hypothetical protein